MQIWIKQNKRKKLSFSFGIEISKILLNQKKPENIDPQAFSFFCDFDGTKLEFLLAVFKIRNKFKGASN
jgi:hypothetical protein